MFKWMIIIGIFTIIYTIPKILLFKWLNSYDPKYKKNIIVNKHTKEKVISLTIDDAPYGDSFRNIVSTLNEHNVKATFFVISDYIQWFRQDIINAVKDGHELANHGATNRMAVWLSTKDLYKEINFCNNELYHIYDDAGMKEIHRVNNRFYRPGSGFISKNMINMIAELDIKIVLGSVYPHDAHIPIWQLNLWYLQYKIESGDIIVLHDRNWTVPLLRELLPWLKKENYKIKTLSKFTK